MACRLVKTLSIARPLLHISRVRRLGPPATVSTFALSRDDETNRTVPERVSCRGDYKKQWSLGHTPVIGRRNISRRVESCKGRRAGGRGGIPGAVAEAEVEVDADGDEEVLRDGERRNRNQSKRESKRARKWGMELATLTPAQVERAIRCAGLSEDVYDAVMIVKNLGISSRVRNGRRRQYNYIGGLLRDVDPNVMEPLLLATKNGEIVQSATVSSTDLPDSVAEDEESDDYDKDSSQVIAEEWSQGLLRGDPAIENEVYSISDVDYDRQELRRIVRNARKSNGTGENSADANDSDGIDLSRTKIDTNLKNFLLHIAKQQAHNEILFS